MPNDLKDGDLRGPAGLGGTPNQHLVSQVSTAKFPLAKRAVLSVACFGDGELEFRFPQRKGPQKKVRISATSDVSLFGGRKTYHIVGIGGNQEVFVLEDGKHDSKTVDWFMIRELNPFIGKKVGETVYLMGESAPFQIKEFTSARTAVVEKVQEKSDVGDEPVPDVRHVPWQDVRDLGLRFSISRTGLTILMHRGDAVMALPLFVIKMYLFKIFHYFGY